MVRKIGCNLLSDIKQDIGSIYFPISVALFLLICLISPGIGALEQNIIGRPMIIEELLRHTKTEFLNFPEMYNYESVFGIGLAGLIYFVLPLASISSVNRYCEERISGYWIHKNMKAGLSINTFCNVIASSVVSVCSAIAGLLLFLGVLVLRLPKQSFHVSIFASKLAFVCLLCIVGAILSILVAALTGSTFYSIVVPPLLFYTENEFLLQTMYGNFAVKSLLNPVHKGIATCFMVILILSLYLILSKMEKGRCGIGV